MKLREICKSKIHHATVTGADVDYIGSVGIDRELMRTTDILPGEKVAIWNVSNGQRIETYAIPLPAGSGQIVVNGAAARHFQRGDTVIIAAFVLTDERVEPRMVVVDAQNRVARRLPDHDASEHVMGEPILKA
jgi:aspartate 1-decarboxylase